MPIDGVSPPASPGTAGDGEIQPLAQSVMAERIHESLRHAIFSLQLKQGDQLVERELAARFGVSKSPVRDALQRLAGEGLVVQTPHKGISVRTLGPQDAAELYQVREVLEVLAVRLATPRLSREHFDAMRVALGRAERAIEASDRAMLSLANREFHETFSANSGNELLAQTLAGLHDRVRMLAVYGWAAEIDMRSHHGEHVEILEDSARGDSRSAASKMREHIRGGLRAHQESHLAGGSTPLRISAG